MRLRLHGTPAECAVAAAGLRRIPDLHIVDQSRPSPDRSGELIRVDLTACLDYIRCRICCDFRCFIHVLRQHVGRWGTMGRLNVGVTRRRMIARFCCRFFINHSGSCRRGSIGARV